MHTPESERWNRRYLTTDKVKTTHSLLLEYRHLFPQQGLVLDLACGEGQNSDYMQKLGLTVFALDFSIIALKKAKKKNPGINAALIDLENFIIPQGKFDIILNFYYLDRRLFPRIINGLKPGGLLFFETFSKEMSRIKPSIRLEHLLEKNELKEAFQSLEPLLYEEVRLEKSQNNVKYVTRLIAKKVE